MPVRGPAPVKLHRKEDAEILQLGAVTCFLLEDGTRTENRVAAVIMMIPPGAKGPPMHWARMHDELFFVTQGSSSGLTIRRRGMATTGAGLLLLGERYGV